MSEEKVEKKFNKGILFRTVIFAVSWIITFVVAVLYVDYVEDVGAFYFMLNIWQLGVLLPVYIFIERKYSTHEFFANRVWCLPTGFYLISLAIFIPFSFIFYLVLFSTLR